MLSRTSTPATRGDTSDDAIGTTYPAAHGSAPALPIHQPERIGEAQNDTEAGLRDINQREQAQISFHVGTLSAEARICSAKVQKRCRQSLTMKGHARRATRFTPAACRRQKPGTMRAPAP